MERYNKPLLHEEVINERRRKEQEQKNIGLIFTLSLLLISTQNLLKEIQKLPQKIISFSLKKKIEKDFMKE